MLGPLLDYRLAFRFFFCVYRSRVHGCYYTAHAITTGEMKGKESNGARSLRTQTINGKVKD